MSSKKQLAGKWESDRGEGGPDRTHRRVEVTSHYDDMDTENFRLGLPTHNPSHEMTELQYRMILLEKKLAFGIQNVVINTVILQWWRHYGI